MADRLTAADAKLQSAKQHCAEVENSEAVQPDNSKIKKRIGSIVGYHDAA